MQLQLPAVSSGRAAARAFHVDRFVGASLDARGRRRAAPLHKPRFRHVCVCAFTLVEIMIVVVIIGLLAALAIPALKRVHKRPSASAT